jgi:hypothetical protein
MGMQIELCWRHALREVRREVASRSSIVVRVLGRLATRSCAGSGLSSRRNGVVVDWSR